MTQVRGKHFACDRRHMENTLMPRDIKVTARSARKSTLSRIFRRRFLTTDESFVKYYADRHDRRPFGGFAGIKSEIDEERYVQLQQSLLYVSPRYVKHVKFLIILNSN